jgi:hypothetical protein
MLKFFDERKPWLLPAVVALLTFICHLVFTVWFWTASPTNAPKTSVKLSGEEYLASYSNWNTDQESDGAFYNRGAVEVLRTGVPRTRSGLFLEHAPLYAYFLAACYKLGGLRWLAFVVPHAALSGLTALLVGLTASRLTARHCGFAGFAASSLVLINVRLAGYAGYPGPTSLVLFLFALAVWALVRAQNGRSYSLFFGAMILAVYTQAAFFIIAFGVGAWALLTFWRGREKALLVGAIALAAFALAKPVISLTMDRRLETYSSEAPTTVLWEANNPYYESMTAFSLWERRPGNNWSKWKITPEQTARFNDYLQRAGGNNTQAALLWIRENPRDYLELCCVRFGAVLGPITGQMSPVNKMICIVTWLLIFPPGLLGLWRLRQTRFAGLAVWVMLVQVAFETLVMAGWAPRYRLPIDLMLCAAAGTVYAAWFGGSFRGSSPVPGGTPAPAR